MADGATVLLAFPTARLLVYNRLIKGGECCVEALLRSAVEFGIIQGYPADAEKLPADEAGCGSHYAARKILDLAMQQRGLSSNGTAHLGEQIWQSIAKDIDEYKRSTSLVHEREAGVRLPAVECSKMAPVVFDILLQKLTPYL